ncbi:hypothetical protein STAQ_06590 [Allostella sp. ATCC 35155]|nr:hypothetical protein STAQ_06590 [Stella sp. ATCC 35155]
MARRIAAIFLLAVWLPTAVLAQAPGAPSLAPVVPAPAATPAAPAPPAEAPQSDRWLPVVAGLGAIAGVVGFNVAALGLQALPGGLAYGAGSVVAAEMSVAMSRVYAITSAVAGGLAGHFAYREWGREWSAAAAGAAETVKSWWPPVEPELLWAGAGAVAGVAAFNILAAPFATVPWAGGALAAVPLETALGSRLVAGLSGAAGAIGATAVYDWVTGHTSDYARASVLAAGALGGIAVGNVLTGTLGTLPYYPGAGQMASTAAGFASATSQAASRFYVIATGVAGAWAADWAWRATTLPKMPPGPR